MNFRTRLLATLRAIQPVLDESGVLVVGSEVPNLLEADAATTLVVSQDVDIGVPVAKHGAVKDRLRQVTELSRSTEEPSVWIPNGTDLIEVNFVGMDPDIGYAEESYVLEDAVLPLLVFGQLSLMRPGRVVDVEGVRIPLPRPAGLILEKLAGDRSGEKGDRDLLVVVGLLVATVEAELDEVEQLFRGLRPESQHAVRSNLAVLSLLQPHEGMPDPRPHRDKVSLLLRRLEAASKVAR